MHLALIFREHGHPVQNCLLYTSALGWPLKSAAMFGILIAATDPVAVIAMFKDNGVGGRLRLLTEAESLFNDGVAAVLFILALGWATDGDVSACLLYTSRCV